MKLAIFSGKPHFTTAQHVGGPIVEEETRRRFHNLADFAFDRNHLTNNGPLAQNLEEQVAALHNTAEAVFVANATLAQMILMKAMGLATGEVLVAANTFVATPHVCEWLGVRPVFCDIDPGTLNMDPGDVAKKITPETRAIIPTHVFGVISDMSALAALAAENKVALLTDAAHAFDCNRGGVSPGRFGVPECLSFHATKYFSTLEGGAVLTNDTGLADELREIRNFGFSQPNDVCRLGMNAKASEISAAFGLASLPALDERRNRLKAVRDTYTRELSGIPGLRIHPLDAEGRNNYRYFAVFIEEEFGLDRDLVREVLKRDNVLARTYFHPGCHRLSYYRERLPDFAETLPQVDKALGSIVCLPTSSPDADPVFAARDIALLLQAMHENAGEIRSWWDRESRDAMTEK